MTPSAPVSVLRRRAFGVALALLVVSGAALLHSSSTARQHSDATAALAKGVAFADSLSTRLSGMSVSGIEEHDALAILYLDRVRLGLGSPFRAIEYALRDKDVPTLMRRPLAMAMLAEVLLGNVYRTPTEAFAVLVGSDAQGMAAHRALIEDVTNEAEDPRIAEIALRYAYQIAIARGSVSSRGSAVIVTAVAQARDRALARRDVEALVRDARKQNMDALDLLPMWRVARRFEVEHPLQDPPSREDDRAAVRLMPSLLERITELKVLPVPSVIAEVMSQPSLGAWEVAAKLAVRRNAPPQAPVVVPLGGFTSYVMAGAGTQVERIATQRFLTASRNEEHLVAEYRSLTGRFGERPQTAIALLNVAVSMRTYAQERPWFPGGEGPSSVELEARYGLARVTFDNRTPVAWRNYYTRMLADAVDDMRRVLPALDVSGLRIHFGDTPLKERALALHDPLSRTIYFPLATGAGAMAHELSHDLDWQAARRVDANRIGYHSDLDARARRRIRGEESAANGSPRDDASAAGAPDRPTEQFARKADWLVASALARSGRINGYLSAYQDSWIPGYASASSPRRDLPMRDATLATMQNYTRVDPAASAAVDGIWGHERVVGVNEMLRRTLLAPMPRWDQRRSPMAGFDAFTTIPRALRIAPELSGQWTCLLATRIPTRHQGAVIEAMTMAAEARVDQLMSRWQGYLNSGGSPSGVRGAAPTGAPWNPTNERLLRNELREGILWRAARYDDGKAGTDFVESMTRTHSWADCQKGE